MRILLAEDEPDLNKILTKRLKNEHYSVDSCYNGEDAMDFIDAAEYDAVILDIMMPRRDGISVLREMRSKKNLTPVILLTAKQEIGDRVQGLDEGADDYLIKPFAYDELLARLRVVFRRNSEQPTNILRVADLEMDCNKRIVTRSGKRIELSAKEFSVLEYLLRNKGIVVSKEKIEQHINNFDYDADTSVVRVYIRYLRRKIDDPYDVKVIHTIRNLGYVIRDGAD